MVVDNNVDLQLTTHLSLASVPFFTITFKLKGNTKRSVNTRNILTVNWHNKLVLTLYGNVELWYPIFIGDIKDSAVVAVIVLIIPRRMNYTYNNWKCRALISNIFLNYKDIAVIAVIIQIIPHRENYNLKLHWLCNFLNTNLVTT